MVLVGGQEGPHLLSLQHVLPRGDAGDKPCHNSNREWTFLRGRMSRVVMYFLEGHKAFLFMLSSNSSPRGGRA